MQHQSRPRRGALYAFLDNTYVTTSPDRTAQAFRSLQAVHKTHANIDLHLAKPRHGTQLERSRPDCAKLSVGARTTRRPGLATPRCPRNSSGSWYWARPWAAPHMCRRLCSPSAKRAIRCWTISWACRTCKARGCYSSCAGPRAPIFSRPKLRSSLPASMMRRSHGAWPTGWPFFLSQSARNHSSEA